MLIVGEKINTSRKFINQAVENRNTKYIQKIALQQVNAKADYIDINAGTYVNNEAEVLKWLVEAVTTVTEAPLCIDSPNPEAIKAALEAYRGKALINSITAEKERFNAIVPLVKEYNCRVVALLMDDKGMPEDARGRMDIAERLVDELTREDIELDRIYLDPLVRPISTGSHYGRAVLDTISECMSAFPGIHTICGLSNISFGLPVRKLLNQAFMIQAMTAGLDGVIVDPTDSQLMSLLIASEALLGIDEWSMNYITAHREGRLEPAPAAGSVQESK